MDVPHITQRQDAEALAWRACADANLEHDQAHERRACDELHRLIPAQPGDCE